MGFFNRNKKKETQAPIHEESIIKSNIEYSITKDGKLQIDYHDNERNVGKMYDMTRLIIDNVPTKLNNRKIYKGLVSWYGKDDTVILDAKTGEDIGSSGDYREILAEIDFRLIQTDPQYCEKVMKSLLRQSRVKDYLSRGLQDKPDRFCGEYIGGVIKTAEGYKRIFDILSGKEAHQRPEMVMKRARYKEMMKRRKQNQIAGNKAEIARLQGEIDNWSR